MSEREALLKKAARYLESASLLSDSGDLDSAISRIYYAAFFIAEALLDTLGKNFSSHRAVISAFGQEFAKTGLIDARYHKLLIVAFEKRQQGDYLPISGIEKEEVDELLGEARNFMKEAFKWLSSQ